MLKGSPVMPINLVLLLLQDRLISVFSANSRSYQIPICHCQDALNT